MLPYVPVLLLLFFFFVWKYFVDTTSPSLHDAEEGALSNCVDYVCDPNFKCTYLPFILLSPPSPSFLFPLLAPKGGGPAQGVEEESCKSSHDNGH